MYARYSPLVEHVRHRSDLNYVIGQMGSELAVGHSYFGGGDIPRVESTPVGLLGRIWSGERAVAHRPDLHRRAVGIPASRPPLDQPGMQVREGDYLLAVEGMELTADEDPYQLRGNDGAGRCASPVSRTPSMDDAWTEVVVPMRTRAASPAGLGGGQPPPGG